MDPEHGRCMVVYGCRLLSAPGPSLPIRSLTSQDGYCLSFSRPLFMARPITFVATAVAKETAPVINRTVDSRVRLFFFVKSSFQTTQTCRFIRGFGNITVGPSIYYFKIGRCLRDFDAVCRLQTAQGWRSNSVQTLF